MLARQSGISISKKVNKIYAAIFMRNYNKLNTALVNVNLIWICLAIKIAAKQKVFLFMNQILRRE
jgi:hypothetical protein